MLALPGRPLPEAVTGQIVELGTVRKQVRGNAAVAEQQEQQLVFLRLLETQRVDCGERREAALKERIGGGKEARRQQAAYGRRRKDQLASREARCQRVGRQQLEQQRAPRTRAADDEHRSLDARCRDLRIQPGSSTR
jgi:hypothetical protein